MATIAVLGTLDTKGHEHLFVAEQLRKLGHDTLLIDVGSTGQPQVEPHITCWEIATLADINLQALIAKGDRGESVAAMASAAPLMLAKLHQESRIDGVISLGGGGGTAIATAAMRALPIGVPKLMVSTLASGNTAHYVGTSDIVMMPSVVDVAGLNRISRMVLTRAAGAIAGMVSVEISVDQARPLIVASMFGNTTQCVNEAKSILEANGYEVLVFHATGTGGRAMETLIESGMVAGVLDITTTEWADELVGGVLSAGPQRLDAAGKRGVPAIVTPGCLDMANFGERQSVPEKYAHRNLYIHNPQVTLMRTNAEECKRLGEILAQKLNQYKSPVTVLLPTRGISIISTEGQPFHDPAADAALFDALTQHLHKNIEVKRLDCAINDPTFATACAESLLANMRRRPSL